jgi:hypothetical protein
VGAGCSACRGSRQPPPAPSTPRELDLFFFAELKGTIEPCGCTTDPLGDLARAAKLIADTKKARPVLLFDGGSTLFSHEPLPTELHGQATMKADLLSQVLSDFGLAAAGLGPYDLAMGPERLSPPRHAVNVEKGVLKLAPPRVIEAGGVKVGVFGVVDPELLRPFGVVASDAATAARGAIQSLRAQGAEVVVALAHMTRAQARKVFAQAPGADFVLAGRGAPEPDKTSPSPDVVDSTFVVQPANRGQMVARLSLTVAPAGGPFSDAIGDDQARARVAKLDEELARLRADIAKAEVDPSADPTFVKGWKDELVAKEQERASLSTQPLRKPAKGSFFVLHMVPIKKGLPCDAAVQRRKQAYDKAVGEANLKAAASEGVTPVPPGGAGHVGVEECGYCHKAAVDFWRTTRHAEAWETLETRNKHLNRDCISCHVTGWHEPGGATLAKNATLRDVQCEQCHGAASLHVDADGHEKPASLVRSPTRAVCAECHTPEHSDTFDFTSYLRDVTGPGHGETFRASLGDGKTGHELRSAALDKAGKVLGAGCAK